MQHAVTVDVVGFQQERDHQTCLERQASHMIFWAGTRARRIQGMNRVQIAREQVQVTASLAQDIQNSLHLPCSLLVILPPTPRICMRGEEQDGRDLPGEFDLQQRLIEDGQAMIPPAHRCKATELGHMKFTAGLPKDQVHPQVVGQSFSMRTAISLQKSDCIGLLPPDHLFNAGEAILSAKVNIIAENTKWHRLLLLSLGDRWR